MRLLFIFTIAFFFISRVQLLCQKDGRFGSRCRWECHCANATEVCHQVTGACQSGCSDQFWGPRCLFPKTCVYDSSPNNKFIKGLFYTGAVNMMRPDLCGRCKSTADSATLLKYECRTYCPPPFYENYTVPCQYWNTNTPNNIAGLHITPESFADKEKGFNSNYARNFKMSDLQKRFPWCFHYKYSMSDTKWGHNVARGVGVGFAECENCPLGLWGQLCENECYCSDINEACNRTTGFCKSGCVDGYSGDNCTECQKGFYGNNCSERCSEHCNDTNCNPFNGTCYNCKGGFWGVNCTSACIVADCSSCDKETGLLCQKCNCESIEPVCSKTTETISTASETISSTKIHSPSSTTTTTLTKTTSTNRTTITTTSKKQIYG